MIDRCFLRDVTFAVLLGLPTLALARPQADVPRHHSAAAPLIEQAALVEQSPIERRFNVPAAG